MPTCTAAQPGNPRVNCPGGVQVMKVCHVTMFSRIQLRNLLGNQRRVNNFNASYIGVGNQKDQSTSRWSQPWDVSLRK